MLLINTMSARRILFTTRERKAIFITAKNRV